MLNRPFSEIEFEETEVWHSPDGEPPMLILRLALGFHILKLWRDETLKKAVRSGELDPEDIHESTWRSWRKGIREDYKR